MIVARRCIASAGIVFAGATLLLFHTHFCAWVSGAAAAAGVGVLALLLLEIASGAGAIVHTQFERGDEIFREVEFRPSLTTAQVCVYLAAGLVGQVIGFAGLFAAVARASADAFSAWTDDRIAAVYFSAVTFATVGFGDIVPRSSLARSGVLVEITFSFTSIAIVVSSLVSWIMAQSQRENERKVRERAEAVQDVEDALRKAKAGLYLETSDAEKFHELMRRCWGE